LYPDTYKVFSNLGILYYRKGQDDLAQENFKKSIESSPESGCISYYYLGHLALKERKFSQAITNYEKAARGVCSGFHDAHFALAQTLQRDHQYERARKKYLDITSQFPNTKIAEKALDNLRYLP
jgi:TolA-binding protein